MRDWGGFGFFGGSYMLSLLDRANNSKFICKNTTETKMLEMRRSVATL